MKSVAMNSLSEVMKYKLIIVVAEIVLKVKRGDDIMYNVRLVKCAVGRVYMYN
jgi:hypothetical protein